MRFDIEKYKRHASALDDHDIGYDRFGQEPLDEATLRCLRYMHDVEFHTVCYLRDLLATPAHADPDITTFLTFWAYEEHWHGEAIGRVLAAHDEPAGTERLRAMGRRHGPRERLGPLISVIATSASKNFTAVHMAWGAVNEWTTQAGYLRLAARARHPVLSELLRRIARQEGHHIDFYASQAARMLKRSRSAQRLVRIALDRAWRPVGSSVMPAAETAHLVRHLFGGEDGWVMARRIDRRIERLPGLADLGLVTRAVGRVSGGTTSSSLSSRR